MNSIVPIFKLGWNVLTTISRPRDLSVTSCTMQPCMSQSTQAVWVKEDRLNTSDWTLSNPWIQWNLPLVIQCASCNASSHSSIFCVPCPIWSLTKRWGNKSREIAAEKRSRFLVFLGINDRVLELATHRNPPNRAHRTTQSEVQNRDIIEKNKASRENLSGSLAYWYNDVVLNHVKWLYTPTEVRELDNQYKQNLQCQDHHNTNCVPIIRPKPRILQVVYRHALFVRSAHFKRDGRHAPSMSTVPRWLVSIVSQPSQSVAVARPSPPWQPPNRLFFPPSRSRRPSSTPKARKNTRECYRFPNTMTGGI